jgi:hypothetical protein
MREEKNTAGLIVPVLLLTTLALLFMKVTNIIVVSWVVVFAPAGLAVFMTIALFIITLIFMRRLLNVAQYGRCGEKITTETGSEKENGQT